ncbi:MAG: decarboxylating NADP(+)-dependent phosphogluconate dehydrogenase [Acidimicrobiia bacterium]
MAADIGLVGLAVMGQNLALNMADHGYRVAVFNRTRSVTDGFLAGPGAGPSITGAFSLEELVRGLERPRRVMLMIKAGPPVDAVLDELVPLLDEGDIVIDGGNSLFTDTIRRSRRLEGHDLRFIGTGISGGEEGARHGPSIMPGGSPEAWAHVKEILQAIAARTADGTPCCDWVGSDGAGHYVKMVHNGIEYGDMQVIAEAYHLMRALLGMSHDEMSEAFRRFGDGVLDSFLIGITADILATRDEDGGPLVEKILDSAGQKGTGKWTVISSLELGQPVTLVAEAVYARIVSALKDQRVAATTALTGPSGQLTMEGLLPAVHDALYASKIVSYAQGFMLLRAAASEYGWDFDYGRIASLWREGCIIRAAFLDDITSAFRRDPQLHSLMLDPFFQKTLAGAQDGWRLVVAEVVRHGIPVPAYSSALAFYDAYRTERLPANLIQAQRDYFGAHNYERIDRPRGEFFHTDWTGRGGEVTSGSYQV